MMRKWLKRVAWAIGSLLVVLVLAGLVINYLGHRMLERELVAWRAIGGKTELADLFPADIPDDQNAAVLYRQALKLAQSLPDEQREIISSWRTADPQALADAVAAHSEVLRLIHEGAKRPDCNWWQPRPADMT